LEREAPYHDPGPVVTLSRETGCPGKRVAQLLQEELNKRKEKNDPNPWKWIGKEIFIEAAKELDLDPVNVKEIFNHKSTIVEEIIRSQSKKYYVNERRVKKIIGDVIKSMANDGNVIVLGRGGVSLTRDIPKSIHVQIVAPIQWRLSVVMEKECMSERDALKYIRQTDRQREQYRNYYHGKGNDYTTYDVKFNAMTFSIEEIVQSIIKMMEIRHII